jgi:hypothetical protein
MARSDVIRADLERIRSMPDEEFEAQWADWCRQFDRDPALMRERWISDLQWNLDHAELEEDALVELTAAKDAYRDDPTTLNKARRATAVAVVREVRVQERSRPGRQMVAGDAYVTGG